MVLPMNNKVMNRGSPPSLSLSPSLFHFFIMFFFLSQSLPVLTVKIQHDPVKSTAVVSLQSYADTGALLEVVNLSHELSIKFMQG